MGGCCCCCCLGGVVLVVFDESVGLMVLFMMKLGV